MREFIGSALRLAGFDVETAADGLSALKEIDRRRPNVLVLDLDLPVMNGFAVHSALLLQAHTRDLPVVVVSGTGWQSPYPVAATLTKPISADDLVATVCDGLSRFPVGANVAHDARVIVWLCPRCRRGVRETQEPGHPIASEMRLDTMLCHDCLVEMNDGGVPR